MFSTAILFRAFSENDPISIKRKERGMNCPTFLEELKPLRKLRVWQFSLYYFFSFGGFITIALWLPRFYMGVYDLDLRTAGILTIFFILPGSIFRILGGWLSDEFGARSVMYISFVFSFLCCFILSYPSTDYIISGINGPIKFNITIPLEVTLFLTANLGFFMSLGKAAVYEHIPTHFPDNVGSVGGVVGMVGGLGGFVLPITFGILNDYFEIWTSCFMFLTVLVIGIMVIPQRGALFSNNSSSGGTGRLC